MKMNDCQVYEALCIAGISVFVKYYHLTSNELLPRWQVAAIVAEKEGYTFKASLAKVNASRRIIENGESERTMLYIVHSPRVPYWIRRQANTYLAEAIENEVLP